MYFIYSFALAIYLFLAFPRQLVRFRRYLPTLADRFGFVRLPQLQHSIWVHAVSVGEVKAVERLLEGLRRQFPEKPLVVSTTTLAGQTLACKRRDIIDYTFYFPVDLPWCVRRVVDRVSPEMVLMAETEIWPNFLRACRSHGIRVVMINGRISDRSFPRYRLLRPWLRRVFADYTFMGMQSEIDRQRIEAIGADPDKVVVFGNLKYDVVLPGKPLDPALVNFLENWHQTWVAASTMQGEEELVFNAFSKLRTCYPDLKLIVAPRHPDRFDAVQELVKQYGFSYVRRTQLDHPANVLLLDTIGELAAVFQYATVVFMGGTLVATGGHNVLEPARHHKPIVFGPHMENFRDMARMFLAADAAIQIQNAAQLASVIETVLSNPERASELGRNAHAIVVANTGATDRVLKFFQPVEARR